MVTNRGVSIGVRGTPSYHLTPQLKAERLGLALGGLYNPGEIQIASKFASPHPN